MAMLPLDDANIKLRGFIAESRDEALKYARRVVHYRPRWELCSDDMATFAEFVKIVEELNDLRLFNDVLLAVDLKCVDEDGAFVSAVQHFGWHTCVDSVVKCIISSSTFSSRVNLVNSLLFTGIGADRVDPMLQALLSLYPWTDAKEEAFDANTRQAQVENFELLVAAAFASSPQKMIEVASVTDEQLLLHVVVPAVVHTTEEFKDVPSLRALLRHVWGLFQPVLAKVRNEWHAKIRLPTHCEKCDELQSFLLSSATETTISFTDLEQRQHIEAVIYSAVTRETKAEVHIEDAGGTTCRLIKERRWTIFREEMFSFAQSLNERMLALNSKEDDQANETCPQHS